MKYLIFLSSYFCTLFNINCVIFVHNKNHVFYIFISLSVKIIRYWTPSIVLTLLQWINVQILQWSTYSDKCLLYNIYVHNHHDNQVSLQKFQSFITCLCTTKRTWQFSRFSRDHLAVTVWTYEPRLGQDSGTISAPESPLKNNENALGRATRRCRDN